MSTSTNAANSSVRARKSELAAALMEKQRRRAAKSLLEFTKMTYPEYQPGWFHRKLAAILDRFFEDVNAGRSPQPSGSVLAVQRVFRKCETQASNYGLGFTL